MLAEAPAEGITAGQMAERYPNRVNAVSNIGTALSRARKAGLVRKSGKKVHSVSPAGRKSKSYAWFITGRGLDYLASWPDMSAPHVTPLDEKPTVPRVLEILKEAGEQGMIGPVLARHFTIEEVHAAGKTDSHANLQRRETWVNKILERQAFRGRARRGEPEISPYYHQVPAFRWYITDKGVQYLAGGCAEGAKERRVTAQAAEAAARAAARRRRENLITQAYVDYDPHTTPRCVREQAIKELRAAGCTLEEISGVFGITRERVRQIQIGYKCGVCRCPRHAEKEFPAVPIGNSDTGNKGYDLKTAYGDTLRLLW